MTRKKPSPARSRTLARRAPSAPAARRESAPPRGVLPVRDGPNVAAVRSLFWHNVMREILTSLSALGQGAGPGLKPRDGESDLGDIFDGRLAVLTQGGERIPIGRVSPVLACGPVGGAVRRSVERSLSIAVECTVFEIVTPDGESFTLPLHEIRAFHSITAELVERIERAALEQREGPDMPFGFAAFTSLVRGDRSDEPDDAPI